MLNEKRLKRCLHLAKNINRCLARITMYAGDPCGQSIELEVLCKYADLIKKELSKQRLEDYDELLNSDEFISAFAKKWGETDEEE